MGKADIGPKIGLEGEAEFRKQLTEVNQSLKTLGTEMKVVTSEFANNAKSEEALTEKNKVLSKSTEELEKKLEMQNKALEFAKANYDENSSEVQRWQQEVNKTQAALNKANNEIEKNTADIAELNTVTDGADSKWSKFGSAVATGAKVAAEALAALGAAAAAAVTAVGKMALDSAKWADDIVTLSQQTGISTENLQKYEYAAGAINVEVSTITGSLTKLTKNMYSAKDGTGSAAEAFAQLGVQVTDASGNLRDNEDVFADVIDALGGIDNEAERDALAMQIMGKSAQQLNPLIKGGAEELEKLGKEAEDAGLILEDDAVQKLGSVNDAMETMKASAKQLGRQFSVQFAEPIGGAVETVTGYIHQLSSAFQEGGLAGAADAIGTILTDISAKVTEYLPQVMEFAMQLVQTLLTGLIEQLPQIVQTGVIVLQSLMSGLSEMLPELIPLAVEAVLTIVDTLISNADMLINGAIQIITALANGLIDSLPKLIEKAPELIQSLVTAIVNNVPKLLEASLQIIVKLAEGIIQNLPKIVQSAGQIIQSLVQGIGNLISQVWDIGKRIVEGIWQGIQNAASWFASQVKNFFSGIIKSVKSVLGIKSPSKVFAGIGKNMALGLGVGFEDEIGSIQDDIDRSVAGLVPSTNSTVSLSASGSSTWASGNTGSAAALAAAIKSALNGAAVVMDGRKVGSLVTNSINNTTRARGAAVLL